MADLQSSATAAVSRSFDNLEAEKSGLLVINVEG